MKIAKTLNGALAANADTFRRCDWKRHEHAQFDLCPTVAIEQVTNPLNSHPISPKYLGDVL